MYITNIYHKALEVCKRKYDETCAQFSVNISPEKLRPDCSLCSYRAFFHRFTEVQIYGGNPETMSVYLLQPSPGQPCLLIII